MSVFNETFWDSKPTAAALLGQTFVSINSSGQWAQTAAGAQPDGLLDRASAGVGDQTRAFMLPTGTRPKAKAGGTIAVGANVAVGAGGTLVTATTGAIIVGKAFAAAVAGDIVLFKVGTNGAASA